MMPERLTKAIKNNKLSHAYIIEGDELSEKSEFATEFARAILCEETPGMPCRTCRTCRMISEGTYRDIYRVFRDERSVKDKDIEELQERLAKLPIERSKAQGGRNIAIVENADTMTTRAQNRLLKSLEEPEPGTVIMLLSENNESLLPTIRSRCQTVRLYGFEADESNENEYIEMARTLIEKAKSPRKSYFFESKELIEDNLKDRASALSILDAIERELREYMISAAKSGEDIEFYSSGIRIVEEARKNIRYNVREKYALSDLLLKIGG